MRTHLFGFLTLALGSSTMACSGDDDTATDPTAGGLENTGGSGATSEGTGGGSATDDECVLGLCPPENGIQLALDTSLGSGEETTFCQFELIEAGGDFGRLQHRYTDISHHMILYPTTWTVEDFEADAGVDFGQAVPCAGVTRNTAGIIYSAQSPETNIDYPEGVAYSIPENHIVLIEYHALNATGSEGPAQVRLNLEYAEGTIDQHAGTLFFYNYSILVPPNGTSTSRMRCEVPVDLSTMWASSHMHARGTAQRSWLLDAEGNRIRDLFDTDQWSEPGAETFDPPVTIEAGSFVEFECEYENQTESTIIEGPHTTNEMCMAPMGYFASVDAPFVDFGTRLCFRPGSGPIYDGTASCRQTEACLDDAWAVMGAERLAMLADKGSVTYPDDYADETLIAVEECFVNTSAEASQAVHDLYGPVITGTGGCRNVACNWEKDDTGANALDADGNPIPGPCNFKTSTDAECAACLEAACPEALAACTG